MAIIVAIVDIMIPVQEPTLAYEESIDSPQRGQLWSMPKSRLDNRRALMNRLGVSGLVCVIITLPESDPARVGRGIRNPLESIVEASLPLAYNHVFVTLFGYGSRRLEDRIFRRAHRSSRFHADAKHHSHHGVVEGCHGRNAHGRGHYEHPIEFPQLRHL